MKATSCFVHMRCCTPRPPSCACQVCSQTRARQHPWSDTARAWNKVHYNARRTCRMRGASDSCVKGCAICPTRPPLSRLLADGMLPRSPPCCQRLDPVRCHDTACESRSAKRVVAFNTHWTLNQPELTAKQCSSCEPPRHATHSSFQAPDSCCWMLKAWLRAQELNRHATHVRLQIDKADAA